jgi:outer membrane beta-barrel protein
MKMKFKTNLKLLQFFLIAAALLPNMAWAQINADDLEVINLEDLYKKEEVKLPQQQIAPPVTAAETAEATTAEVKSEEVVVEQKPEEIKVKELKDLNQLVPFSEISVIQRKYMPKSERLQVYLGAGLTTNTPWFTNYGGKLNISYNFTESFGIELSTLFLSSSPRDVAKEIQEQHNVKADQFVYTKSYYGLDLVWSPIYGKMTFDNTNIINYEMYFSLGAGQSKTNSVEKDVTTAHLGIGQIFSLSKSMAFRWDYGLNVFQATPASASLGQVEKSIYNDLVLTAGLSFFFPEVTYR